MRHWQELLTCDSDGNEMRLTDFLSECQEGALIGNITLDQFGQLATWDQRYVYFPGEEPGPETPRAPVDWQGFSSVVAAIVEPDDGTICGKTIQHDHSGIGHNWRTIARSDIPANIIDEIEGEIIDGQNQTCDEFTTSNGLKYRWK